MTGREKDSSGVTNTTNYWQHTGTAVDYRANSRFVFLNQKEDILHDSTQLWTDYSYDCATVSPCYGLLTKTHNEGILNDAGDDTWVTTPYGINTANWVFVPEQEVTTDSASGGNVLRRADYYYDGHGSYSSAPDIGRLTAASTLVDTATGETSNVYTQYDSTGAVYRQSIPTSQSPVGSSSIPSGLPYTQTTYDATFHTFAASITNPLGQPPTTYTSDPIHSAISAAGANPVPVVEAAPNGHITRTQYDVFGRPTKIWDDFDSATYPTKLFDYGWGAYPNRTIVYERTQHGTTSTRATATCMDGFGREIETRSSYHGASGTSYSSSVTAYNVRGLKAAVANPADGGNSAACTGAAEATGNRTAYTYDTQNNVTTTMFLGGQTSPYTEAIYNGRTTTLYDELANQTTRVQDLAARTLTVTDPAGSTVYQYDRVGNLTSVRDASNNVTNISYDLAGRKTWMHDPDMGNWTYSYDTAGNLKTQTDARGQTTALNYDSLNRLTRKTYSNGQPSVSFTYDTYPDTSFCTQAAATAKGRMTRMVDGAGQQLSCYDTRGEELNTRRTIDGGVYDISRTFFATGQVKDLYYPVDGEHVAYTLNGDDGSIAGMNIAGGEMIFTNLVNKPWGAPASFTLGSGLGTGPTTTYSYDDPRMRLTRIQTATAQDLTLTYDYASNVHTITDNTGTPETATYGYDASNRLTSMSIAGVTYASYDYNAIGNMTKKNEASPSQLCYPASGAGSVHPHAVTGTYTTGSCSAPTTTMTYDANGNMIASTGNTGTTSYSFDAENRLRSRLNGVGMVYTYDGNGALLKRTSTSDGAYTVYVAGIFEETSAGSVTKYYQALGRSVAMRMPWGPLRFLLADHLGSTVGMIDYNTGDTQSAKYWPYGDTRLGSLTTDKRYTGQQQEPVELGLYFYHARFYSTTLGRFVSADPIAPTTDARGLNRYTYTADNPLRYVDPTGHCFTWLGKKQECSQDIAKGWILCGIKHACSDDLNRMAEWAIGLQEFYDNVKGFLSDASYKTEISKITNTIHGETRRLYAGYFAASPGEKGENSGPPLPIALSGDNVVGKAIYDITYSYVSFKISVIFATEEGDPSKAVLSLHIRPGTLDRSTAWDHGAADEGISVSVDRSLFDPYHHSEIDFGLAVNPAAFDQPPLYAKLYSSYSGAIALDLGQDADAR
jgi:RHS repeat-associated protein